MDQKNSSSHNFRTLLAVDAVAPPTDGVRAADGEEDAADDEIPREREDGVGEPRDQRHHAHRRRQRHLAAVGGVELARRAHAGRRGDGGGAGADQPAEADGGDGASVHADGVREAGIGDEAASQAACVQTQAAPVGRHCDARHPRHRRPLGTRARDVVSRVPREHREVGESREESEGVQHAGHQGALAGGGAQHAGEETGEAGGEAAGLGDMRRLKHDGTDVT